jgi:predicted dehydrogenase
MSGSGSGASSLTRRSFLGHGAALGAAAALPGILPAAGRAPLCVGGSDELKIGVIGCGGRGSGAVVNCIESSPGVRLHAIGELFSDRMESARKNLGKRGELFQVPDDRAFVGFDAVDKVLATDVDLVILATPPAFRPEHLAKAIAAGKHVFMEKPVAVCPAGIRSVIASAKLAKDKGLGIVAGTQRRHQESYLETIRRIQDGAIGEVIGGRCSWNMGFLWKHDRKESYSDVEWQIRNWLYFTWSSGDHIVEQHVHNLDVINWVMGAYPERCDGMGGREVRTDDVYGNIFDHHAIEFVYPGGRRAFSYCRQISGCANNVSEEVWGSKGRANPGGWIQGAEEYRYRNKKRVNPYVQEHTDLIASIRSGSPLNEGEQIAKSTLTAIMGRMATYTGKTVTWDFALNESKLDLRPNLSHFGKMAFQPVSVPGRTKLI